LDGDSFEVELISCDALMAEAYLSKSHSLLQDSNNNSSIHVVACAMRDHQLLK